MALAYVQGVQTVDVGDGVTETRQGKASLVRLEVQLSEAKEELELVREELCMEKERGLELKRALSRSEEVLQRVVKESEDLRSQLKATRAKGQEMAEGVRST